MKELVIKIGETISECIVSLDGETLGGLQHVEVVLDSDNLLPSVELIFNGVPDKNSEIAAKFTGMPHVKALFEECTQIWESNDLPNDPSDLSKWDEILNKKE